MVSLGELASTLFVFLILTCMLWRGWTEPRFLNCMRHISKTVREYFYRFYKRNYRDEASRKDWATTIFKSPRHHLPSRSLTILPDSNKISFLFNKNQFYSTIWPPTRGCCLGLPLSTPWAYLFRNYSVEDIVNGTL